MPNMDELYPFNNTPYITVVGGVPFMPYQGRPQGSYDLPTPAPRDDDPYEEFTYNQDPASGSNAWPYNVYMPSYGAPTDMRVTPALARSYMQGVADGVRYPGTRDITDAVYYDIATSQLYATPLPLPKPALSQVPPSGSDRGDL